MNGKRRPAETSVLRPTEVIDGLMALGHAHHGSPRLTPSGRQLLHDAAYLIAHLQSEIDRHRPSDPAEAPDDYDVARAEHARIQRTLADRPMSHGTVLTLRLKRARIEARYPEMARFGGAAE